MIRDIFWQYSMFSLWLSHLSILTIFAIFALPNESWLLRIFDAVKNSGNKALASLVSFSFDVVYLCVNRVSESSPTVTNKASFVRTNVSPSHFLPWFSVKQLQHKKSCSLSASEKLSLNSSRAGSSVMLGRIWIKRGCRLCSAMYTAFKLFQQLLKTVLGLVLRSRKVASFNRYSPCAVRFIFDDGQALEHSFKAKKKRWIVCKIAAQNKYCDPLKAVFNCFSVRTDITFCQFFRDRKKRAWWLQLFWCIFQTFAIEKWSEISFCRTNRNFFLGLCVPCRYTLNR